MNQYALKIIKEFEDFRAMPYYCPAGFLTIGYGTRIKPGEYQDGITEPEAEKMLIEHMQRSEATLDRVITSPLSVKQFGALLSLCYNIGDGNFCKSTLLKRLNAGAYEEAAEQFLVWVKSGNKELAGLKRRRIAEKQLFEEDL